jgi:hypothetical protein
MQSISNPALPIFAFQATNRFPEDRNSNSQDLEKSLETLVGPHWASTPFSGSTSRQRGEPAFSSIALPTGFARMGTPERRPGKRTPNQAIGRSHDRDGAGFEVFGI